MPSTTLLHLLGIYLKKPVIFLWRMPSIHPTIQPYPFLFVWSWYARECGIMDRKINNMLVILPFIPVQLLLPDIFRMEKISVCLLLPGFTSRFFLLVNGNVHIYLHFLVRSKMTKRKLRKIPKRQFFCYQLFCILSIHHLFTGAKNDGDWLPDNSRKGFSENHPFCLVVCIIKFATDKHPEPSWCLLKEPLGRLKWNIFG